MTAQTTPEIQPVANPSMEQNHASGMGCGMSCRYAQSLAALNSELAMTKADMVHGLKMMVLSVVAVSFLAPGVAILVQHHTEIATAAAAIVASAPACSDWLISRGITLLIACGYLGLIKVAFPRWYDKWIELQSVA